MYLVDPNGPTMNNKIIHGIKNMILHSMYVQAIYILINYAVVSGKFL